MANVTGKMSVTTAAVNGSVEILNRPHPEGVPMTLADEAFAENEVVKAGTLIKADGTVSNDGSDPVGVLRVDVYKDRPTGTILKKAYVNLKRIKESVGDSYWGTAYTDVKTLKTALPMIEFEDAPGE